MKDFVAWVLTVLPAFPIWLILILWDRPEKAGPVMLVSLLIWLVFAMGVGLVLVAYGYGNEGQDRRDR